MIFIIIFIVLMSLFVFVSVTRNTGGPNGLPIVTLQPTVNNLNSKRGESSNGVYRSLNGVNLTDSVTCNSFESSNWDMKCLCRPPFFGPTCSEEAMRDTYYDVGNYTPPTGVTITKVNRLSFPYTYDPTTPFVVEDQIKCTDLCDATAGCSGVYYTQGPDMGVKSRDNSCVLIQDGALSGYTFNNYNSNLQGNVFYKKTGVPVYSNSIVFFSSGSITLPTRYWISNTPTSMIVYENSSVHAPPPDKPQLITLFNKGITIFPNFAVSMTNGYYVFSDNPSLVVAQSPPPTGNSIANGVYIYTNTLTSAFTPNTIVLNFSSTGWDVLYGRFFATNVVA
jgi:hypothetical protein